jgi:hypothetical protein
MGTRTTSLSHLYTPPVPREDAIGRGWEYRWGQTLFRVYGPTADGFLGKVLTIFEGEGHLIVNVSRTEPHQAGLPEHFGYSAGDYPAMNMEHDPLHCAIAAAENMLRSPSLWLVSRNEHTNPEHFWDVHADECKVWALARLINLGEWYPEPLGPVLGADEEETRRLATVIAARLRQPEKKEDYASNR